MARYRGVIHLNERTLVSPSFHTTVEAERWIDENNNNYAFKSDVQEVNEYEKVIDWYEYT